MNQTGLQALSSEDPLDSSSFAALFEQNYSRLWVLAAAILGDRHSAEDIVQEAAIVALTRIQQFEPGTDFAAWMSTIVRLQALNWSRKRTRRALRNIDPATLDQRPNHRPPEEPSLDPVARISTDQMLFDDDLMHSLNSLAEIPRACLLLRTIQRRRTKGLGNNRYWQSTI